MKNDATLKIQLKLHERMNKKWLWRHMVVTKIMTTKKNIAGQLLTYNSKNFHWLNRKTRPKMNYEWIEKTILKKSDQKIRK